MIGSTTGRLRSLTNFAPNGMNDYKLFLWELLFTSAVWGEVTCFASNCLLFAIGASTLAIASHWLPLQKNSKTLVHG